jgi:hypothetical protein
MAKTAKKVRMPASRAPSKKAAKLKALTANHRAPWTLQQDRLMKRLAKDRATAAEIATELGRSAAAIQQRLMMSGISLRALRKSKARGRAAR